MSVRAASESDLCYGRPCDEIAGDIEICVTCEHEAVVRGERNGGSNTGKGPSTQSSSNTASRLGCETYHSPKTKHAWRAVIASKDQRYCHIAIIRLDLKRGVGAKSPVTTAAELLQPLCPQPRYHIPLWTVRWYQACSTTTSPTLCIGLRGHLCHNERTDSKVRVWYEGTLVCSAHLSRC